MRRRKKTGDTSSMEKVNFFSSTFRNIELSICKHALSSDNRNYSRNENWNSVKVFSYKEIKVATNNFKEVIGRDSFESVYLGKPTNGNQVAVKVRFDKTQLGAVSFINEVRNYIHASSIPIYKRKI